MSRSDWYRKTTWSVKEKAQFLERLKHSRTDYNKAQYLRIQAHHLQKATPPYHTEAIELLDLLIENHPHPAELASAYMQKAQCLEALDDISQAKDAYLLSLIAEEKRSGVKTTVPIQFAMFVVRHSLKELYGKAFDTLIQDSIKLLTVFPTGQYQACAALAIIADETGNNLEARKFARKALAAAKIKDTGLKHHPQAGLVEAPDEQILRKLRRIARDNFLSIIMSWFSK